MDEWISRASITPQELQRWAVCGTIVLAAHVALVAVVLARPDLADPEAGSPVVMIELAPVAAAPSQIPNDQPPAPQVQPELEERMQQDVQQEKKPDEERVEQTPTQNPDVQLPQRTPDPPKEVQEKVKQTAQEASHAGAPQSADVMAALPRGPAPGQVSAPTTAAMTRWEISLRARIEAVKRYPAGARGARGIAHAAFRIDRNGHVLESRISQSSGSPALDAETLAILKRADPFPAPPAGILDQQLSISVPIEYKLPGEH
jgi:periplasmic protein TonB